MAKAKIIKEWIGERGGKHAILECLNCKKHFEVGAYRLKCNTMCCSKKCVIKYTLKSGKNHPNWKGGEIKRVCQECGKEFTEKPCRIKDGRGKYCSKSCLGKANSKGEKNYFWNGGKTINSGGYMEVKVDSHPYATQRGYIREHILLVENYLIINDPKRRWLHKLGDKLYLNKNIIIHHIDGNKRNNDLLNLYVFDSNEEHSRYHMNLIKNKEIKKLKSNIKK